MRARICFPWIMTLWAICGGDPAEQARELVQRASRSADDGDSARAVQLASKAIQRDRQLAIAYYIRGREHFRLGRIDQSVSDFDRYVELRPEIESRLWERGISYYYAKKFDAGAKQFELYQTFHDNDVENAVWRFLCVARDQNTEQARRTMLPIRNDRRVPMMQIYDLFAGRLSAAEVRKAAEQHAANPSAKNRQLFYAHLYIGLYYEAEGQHRLARQHITRAADKHKIAHYMWDVAHVHANLLRQ